MAQCPCRRFGCFTGARLPLQPKARDNPGDIRKVGVPAEAGRATGKSGKVSARPIAAGVKPCQLVTILGQCRAVALEIRPRTLDDGRAAAVEVASRSLGAVRRRRGVAQPLHSRWRRCRCGVWCMKARLGTTPPGSPPPWRRGATDPRASRTGADPATFPRNWWALPNTACRSSLTSLGSSERRSRFRQKSFSCDRRGQSPLEPIQPGGKPVKVADA